MIGIFGMIGCGLFRISVRGRPCRPRAPDCEIASEQGDRSPGSRWCSWCCGRSPPGCAALTGVEAISNGVPAFRKPKSQNAATTLLLLGGIAITMFVGDHLAGR